jgi:hypothetical protein
MSFVNKTRVSFHSGNAFANEGIDKKPFAVFTYDGIVDRVLIDKICELVRDHTNEHDGDFCNVKISMQDWDC